MACIIEDNNPSEIIFGCTDPLAINYFSGATVDDGSCTYSETIIGCLDPLALNYNPNATFDNGKVCVYEECPEEITIRPTDGAVFYTSTDLSGDINKAQAPPSELPQSVPLFETCCRDVVVGEPVTWNSDLELCIVNRDNFCLEPLAISVDGVILGSNGLPVNESCCNQIDTASWDPNFDNGGKIPGACIDNLQNNNGLCDLSFTDLILNDDGTITVSGGSLGDTGGGDTGGGDTDGDTGVVVSDTEGCLNIFQWTIAFGVEGLDWHLSLDTNDIGNPQLQVGDQIVLSGFQNAPGTTCWDAGPNDLNGITATVEQILYFQNTNTYTIITDIDISGDCEVVDGEVLCGGNCGLNDLVVEEDAALACLNFGESGGNTTNISLGGDFDVSSFINNINNLGNIISEITSGGATEQINISEACCQELGNGLWSYIDGVCYWKPPTQTTSTSIGVSENDVIVTDPACNNLTVCLSFFLEVPDDNQCFDETSNISANLGFYSGDIRTNLFNTSQTLTYNSLEDGYCTWVQICTEIIDYDGTPFKIKINLDGILDCCVYDIFVDDISVSCTIQDSIEVPNNNDCPGFTLNKVIDNKKSWVYNDGEPINRVFAPSADADIPWRYTDYLEQSGVYENHSKLVLNSKELYLTFNMCDSENCDTSLNVFELIEYKKNFQNFWVKFIEQFVPATTIFVSGEKWCTRPEQICKTYEDCDYINDFTKAGLGITTGDGVNDRPKTNKNDNRKVDPNSGDNTVTSEKRGDYGDNSSDDPVIFDNFFGIFIKYDPSADEERLTFPRGLLPLLKEGTDNYRNRMKPPITRLVTS